MSPTGPYYPSTAADAGGGGTAWTNVANAKVEDGSYASCASVGPGGGGGTPNLLNVTNFGFSIPSTAIIDGIRLEAKVATFGGGAAHDSISAPVNLLYSGGATLYANNFSSGQTWPTTGLAWITYGNSTSLWGRAWTPAEINSSSFGAQLSAMPFSGTADIRVDSVRITVFWHTAPTEVPIRYVHQFSDNSGNYLGSLEQQITSDFAISQDINTAGGAYSFTVGLSPDTARTAIVTIDDESGNPIQDESSNSLFTERALDVVGSDVYTTLIRNGNRLRVYEYSYYYPNGKQVFSGQINRWTAPYGSENSADNISVVAYPDGADLSYTPMTAGGTLDQSNTTYDSTLSVDGGDPKSPAFDNLGQTFQTGASGTSLVQISVLIHTYSVPMNITLSVFNAPNGALMGQVTQTVTTSSLTEIGFVLTPAIVTTANTSYFFGLSGGGASGNFASASIAVNSTSVYANGIAYVLNYGGGGTPSYGSAPATDLWFKTYYGGSATYVSYASIDPANMLLDIVTRYQSKGGRVSASAVTVPATGLSASYTFNLAAALEGVQRCQALSPANYYWYVDMGTDVLTMKPTATTAAYTLVKGKHINSIDVTATTENVANNVYFTGGPTAGVNLYKNYTDAASITAYGTRMSKYTDNRVTVSGTADLLGGSYLNSNKNESYQTTVTIPARTMDITLPQVGDVIGFSGFGNFVDRLLLQIVRRDYTSERLVLTLGKLPPRASLTIQQALDDIDALETVANPSAPS